ncbi:helix-turn-helix domain-containing protein [Neobacillus sp. GCM10023253]|uniref:helix-turn-helix domain-containing protein n=1 Tax=Neobacillus sp. GCM10023253 TaxID=3252644 RepID=UPI00361DF226
MAAGEDFQLRLQNIELLSSTLYSGIEIFLVLDGELIIETNSRFYHLKEYDYLVINRNQLYQVKGSKKNTVLTLSVPDSFISTYYSEYRHYQFDLFSQQIDRGKETMMSEMRKLLAQLMVIYCRQEEGYRLEMQEMVCKILLMLIRRFKKEGRISENIQVEDSRLKEIILYLEQHFDEPLTLEEVAHKFYLSPSYFSRYFKQQVGIGFIGFLMNIRLEHSVKDLLYTDESITYISLKNGFPNTKSFSSLFKKVYGETPHTFREKNVQEKVALVENFQLKDTEILLSSPDILMKLGVLITEGENAKSFSNTETRLEELKIEVGSANRKILKHPNQILMIGELRELLKKSVRTQILLAKEDLNIKYIGIQKLLSGRTIPPAVETDELIPTTSPYYNSDEVIQFMKTNELSLFIQVNYTEIATAEDAYLLKLQSFLKHCLQVFGESYLSTWCFLFSETFDQAFASKQLEKFYLKLRKLIKTEIPSIQVGAFLPFSFTAGTTNDQYKWILQQAAEIDFLAYKVSPNEVINFKELIDHHYGLAKDFIKEKTEKLKQYLKAHSIDKPLHLQTWNTISGNTRYTNGTFFRGALILNDAIKVSDDVKTLGFWINTETHEQNMGGKDIPLEGMELFHYFNGKRPVYYAMSFFKKLQGKVVAKGPSYIMTENERGYQLVLMNSNIVNPYFSIEETFLQKLMREMRVTISGIPSGEYQIRKYVFDKDHGALYKNWRENNSKYGMDQEIIDYIIRTSHPSLEVYDEMIDEEWSFYSYLTVNAVHFFEIRKVNL